MNEIKTGIVSSSAIENLDPKTHIIIKGARVHNLKNVDVAIPRNQFVVITGLGQGLFRSLHSFYKHRKDY